MAWEQWYTGFQTLPHTDPIALPFCLTSSPIHSQFRFLFFYFFELFFSILYFHKVSSFLVLYTLWSLYIVPVPYDFDDIPVVVKLPLSSL